MRHKKKYRSFNTARCRYWFIILCTILLQGCSAVLENEDEKLKISAEEAENISERVIDWQLSEYGPKEWNKSWLDATLFAGIVEVAKTTDREAYWEAAYEWAEQNSWETGPRKDHADDHAVGQVYLELYGHYGEQMMIRNFQQTVDGLTDEPIDGRELWWWCDALFMAPPGIARLSAVTGRDDYLKFVNKNFWDAKEFLYDEENRLFFRDSTYFGRRDAMGKPVFWSRGNGWVIAGLVGIMRSLPETDSYYEAYRKLFADMMDRIVQLQPGDGLWRTNLLSPEIHPVPEVSGSAFFCYGLGWGINQGILEEQRYRTAHRKAWEGLQQNVSDAGKVGSAQEPGTGPGHVDRDNSEIYATGAFLMAASEVMKMSGR